MQSLYLNITNSNLQLVEKKEVYLILKVAQRLFKPLPRTTTHHPPTKQFIHLDFSLQFSVPFNFGNPIHPLPHHSRPRLEELVFQECNLRSVVTK